MWSSKRPLQLLLFVLVLPGCGYTLSHRLKGAFTDPRGVFVPMMTNLTEEVGAETIFTDALIRELQSRNEVVVTTRERAARELRGTITSIAYSPTAFTNPGFQGLETYRRLPTELLLTVSLRLELVDPKTTKVDWAGNFASSRRVEVPVSRTYNFQAPSSFGPITQSLIRATYTDNAGDIMRDVYDEIGELF